MDLNEYYTTFDVVKILDLKMERLQDWLKRGYIQPTAQEQVGRGMKKYFDRLQLYVIQAFKNLVENGITREEAAGWVRDIHEDTRQDLDAARQRPDQDKNNIDWLKKLPTYIVVYKGRSPFGEGDAMAITKGYDSNIELNAFMQADAVHVMNFNNIKKQVDARLED